MWFLSLSIQRNDHCPTSCSLIFGRAQFDCLYLTYSTPSRAPPSVPADHRPPLGQARATKRNVIPPASFSHQQPFTRHSRHIPPLISPPRWTTARQFTTSRIPQAIHPGATPPCRLHRETTLRPSIPPHLMLLLPFATTTSPRMAYLRTSLHPSQKNFSARILRLRHLALKMTLRPRGH